jgi:alcohol dehydrogenase (cytochrome c)
MTIHNESDEADALVRANCPLANFSERRAVDVGEGGREFFTGGGPLQPERIPGSVTAIDVTTGKVAGKFETKFPNLGGTLATTDLVFSGEPGGEVYALDGKTPQKPLGFNTGGGVSAPPMTFEVEGKQYVAILVGMGRAWDKGFIDSTPELKTMQPGSTLCVFAL